MPCSPAAKQRPLAPPGGGLRADAAGRRGPAPVCRRSQVYGPEHECSSASVVALHRHTFVTHRRLARSMLLMYGVGRVAQRSQRRWDAIPHGAIRRAERAPACREPGREDVMSELRDVRANAEFAMAAPSSLVALTTPSGGPAD